MRTTALALCCLLLASPLAGCLDFLRSGDDVFDEPEPLRINHIQVLGTHNSYHIEPFGPTIRAYDYTHEPLDVQAEDYGIRQFELDVLGEGLEQGRGRKVLEGLSGIIQCANQEKTALQHGT